MKIQRQYCLTCKAYTISGNPKHINHKVKTIPSNKILERHVFDGVSKSPDGCTIEPDGICQHGYPSWLIIVGVI